MKESYLNRNHKVKTVNIDFSQEQLIKMKKIKLSSLVRMLLDKHFKENYPALYEEILKQDKENKAA